MTLNKEVKQLILVKNVSGESHDSVLIVTGISVTQASLREPGTALFNLNYVDFISEGCKQFFQLRNVDVTVDRVEFCASHVNYEQSNEFVKPVHHVFALVLLRKPVVNGYGHGQEVRIAQISTRLNIGETGKF